MCKAENISMVGIFSQAYTIQYSISVPNNDNNETKIDVSWKRDLSRIPIIGKGFAKDGIFKSTEEALKKIASAAEKTP